jgi:hypothetical protein
LAQISQTRLLRAKRDWPAGSGLTCSPISVALMGDLRSNSSLTDEVLGYIHANRSETRHPAYAPPLVRNDSFPNECLNLFRWHS